MAPEPLRLIAGNLFTRDYLLEGVTRSDTWRGLRAADFAVFKAALAKIATTFLKTTKPNEAQTERDFIYPVLELIGWNDIQVQEILSTKGRKQVPDALLFADADAKAKAAEASVVPEPMKVSSTKSPGSEDDAIIRLSSSMGFCVG